MSKDEKRQLAGETVVALDAVRAHLVESYYASQQAMLGPMCLRFGGNSANWFKIEHRSRGRCLKIVLVYKTIEERITHITIAVLPDIPLLLLCHALFLLPTPCNIVVHLEFWCLVSKQLLLFTFAIRITFVIFT